MTPEEPAAAQAVGVRRWRTSTGGGFATVIDEVDELAAATGAARRVLQRQGVFRSAQGAACRARLRDVALVRIEQLYPFPTEDYARSLRRYPKAREVVWCQEEPQNQGAWYQIRHRLQEALQAGKQLLYAGRGHARRPATGIAKLHDTEQRELVDAALRAPPRRYDVRARDLATACVDRAKQDRT